MVKKIAALSLISVFLLLSIVFAMEIGARGYVIYKKFLKNMTSLPADPAVIQHRTDDTNLFDLIKHSDISDRTFNIYYFGGSTMVGEPFEDHISIPHLVNYMLNGRLNGKEIRSINVSGPGADFGYNLQKLRTILKYKKTTHPDLCVFYSGHNEWLKFSIPEYRPSSLKERIFLWFLKHSIFVKIRYHIACPVKYPLEIDDRRFFDEPLVSPEKHEEIITNYTDSIARSIEVLKDSDTPFIFLTLAANVSSWGPNRSVFSGDKNDKEPFQELFIQGEVFERTGEYNKALDSYGDSLDLCDSYAETYYRLGKCYEKIGDHQKAWSAYRKAIDFDGYPVMGVSSQNDFIRNICEKQAVPLIDSEGLFRDNSPNRITDMTLFVDYCHPNITGYILLAENIAQKIIEMFSPGKILRDVSESEVIKIFKLSTDNLYDILVNRGKSAAQHATLRYYHMERLSIAENYFGKAFLLDPNRHEACLGLAIVDFLRKDTDAAERSVAKASSINNKETLKYLDNNWIKKVIERCYFEDDIE